MSIKSLDSFASAELAEDTLETVSGGGKGESYAVQRSKGGGMAQVATPPTKEGKLTSMSKVDTSKEMQSASKQLAVKQSASVSVMQQNVSKNKY
jgi:hypothetical protein